MTVEELEARVDTLEATVRGLSGTVLDLVEQLKTVAANQAMAQDSGLSYRDAWSDVVLNKYYANDRPVTFDDAI